MADGLLGNAQTALASRKSRIDEAEEATVGAPKPTATAAGMPAPTGKAITADEAAVKAAKYKAEREAFERDTKAMPKPKGVMERLFGG